MLSRSIVTGTLCAVRYDQPIRTDRSFRDTLRQETGDKIRVLIVDDSEAILNFMSRAINSRQGMEVIGSATNGAQAVAMSEDLRPDVVIMDVEMPTMDGLEATRRIKRAHSAIVVILVSGSADLLAASVSAGADGYIAKPFSADALICRVMGNFGMTDTQ